MSRVTSLICKVPTCRYCGALVCLLFLATAGISRAGGTYAKLEASFNLAGLATDPFDYTVTDVKAQVLQPNSTTISLPAFFDGGITWRVRYTPTNAGVYQVTGITLNGSPAAYSNLQPGSWTVTGSPTSPGFVRIDPMNPRRFITDNGRRYFPVGENFGWSSTSANAVNIFPKMGPAHENWSRVWMTHFNEGSGLGLNLDWPKVGGTFGQLSLPNAGHWDAIITAAEQNGIYVQMVLQHHGQYSLTVNSDWSGNPYNTANSGFLSNPTNFFTDAMAKSLTKRKYRYIIARWGYSPAVMAWELFNEVQFTAAAQAGQWANVGAWHDEMAAFLRAQDPYRHLVVTSSENFSQPIWNSMDYYQFHNYASDIVTSGRDGQTPSGGSPIRPNFSGESTPYFNATNAPGIWVHGAVFPSLMSTLSGASCPWWWDSIDPQNAYPYFQAASDFVALSGLADQNVLTKSAPQVTGGSGPLIFAPSGGFATNNGPDTFTVGSTPPAGINAAPSFLQGDYHRVDFKMTNGYTFLVNYAQAGTFSVQILTIAASGAALQISLDGVVQTNIVFPNTGSDINTNFTTAIAVPSGSHSVKLYNPGTDWVNLGALTLDPYVTALGAYAVGNSDFNAAWVWHQANLLNVSASVAVAGTVDVTGLNAGNYSATWWDSVSGGVLSNFNLTVISNNATVTVPTPSILRGAALFVGKAPRAAVTAPVLTQTFGTNSPALTLPLFITNSGGLPLSYSLTITGASPVAYTAVNSSQPGGPRYFWSDISGVGQEISGSFTQLVSPAKTARDEGIAGPFNLGFSFPFFSGAQSPGTYTQIYVSPNGFLTFSPFVGDRSVNTTLPNASAPTNLIAPFWDDLDVVSGSSGRIYVDGDPIAGTFTVQFQNVRFKGTASTVSCQIILKSSGEILFLYQSMATSNACTVGLQNAAANAGLQIAFNQNYLQSNFAIRILPTKWLDFSANAGLLPKSAADTLDVSLNPAGLAYGTYQATALLNTSDASQPLFTLPIVLNITPQGTWRQTNFGASENTGNAADTANPDGDSLINILEYAFNTNPNVANASPLSYAVVGNHLTITFTRARPAPSDITYLYEVADEVTGPWQSGPTFTTQNVTDNGNGTETVTVTDNLLVGSSAAHYLRVRISVP